jgi:hypothetical protein
VKRVVSLDLACPSCGASPGQRCIRLDTLGGANSSHESRRRRAAEEQQRLNPEHSVGQMPLWGKAP